MRRYRGAILLTLYTGGFLACVEANAPLRLGGLAPIRLFKGSNSWTNFCRLQTLPVSLVAASTVSDACVYSFFLAATASASAKQTRLATSFHSIWAEHLVCFSKRGGRVCAGQRFLSVGPSGRPSSRVSRHSGTERNDLPETLYEMQASENPHAENVSACPSLKSISSAQDNDGLVQYVVIRRDLGTELNWPLGAVVAQACHAAVDALGLALEDNKEDAQRYLSEGSNMRTVVLQVSSEAELLKLRDKLTQHQIAHKLWQEEPEKIPTSLASVPIRKSAGRVFKGLKLLS